MVGLFFASSINGFTNAFPQLQTLCIPQFIKPEHFVIDPYRGDQIAKLSMSQCAGFPLGDFTDMFEDWHKLFDEACKWLREEGFDTMIISKVAIFGDFRYGLEDSVRTRLIRKYHNDPKYSFNFNMNKSLIQRLVFVEACFATCKNVYHYVIDPQEADISKLFPEYDVNFRRLTFVRTLGLDELIMPFYEYGLSTTKLESTNDEIDLFFRGFASHKDREFLLGYDKQFHNDDRCHVRVFRKAQGHAIPQDYYFFLLRCSAFTMVFPPYDKNSFSWLRFSEALFNGCLPLVYRKCKLGMLEQSVPDVAEIIKNELIFEDPDDAQQKVKKMSGSKRLDVIQSLMETKSVRHFLDKEWLTRRWSSLKGLGGTK